MLLEKKSNVFIEVRKSNNIYINMMIYKKIPSKGLDDRFDQ